MNSLVICSCGHALDRHLAEGCIGVNGARCYCRHNAHYALEDAVRAVRSLGDEAEPLSGPRR